MTEDEFATAAQQNPDELARLVYTQNQSAHPAKKMLKEMAGPAAGTAVGAMVAMSGIAGVGLAGAAVAGAATVAGSGMGAYFLKETTDKGIRGGWNQAKTAVTDSYKTLGRKTVDQYEDIKTTVSDAATDAMDNDTRYENE